MKYLFTFHTMLVIFLINIFSCTFSADKQESGISGAKVIVGAERTEHYFPMLTGKRIAIVANQTSLIKDVHLVDSLISAGILVVKVFGPEHGFRGEAGAGVEINNNIDPKTGIPVVSLYGNNKKPKAEDLQDIDLVIFDIQDVGARFYTYISTMTYVMEACAENDIGMMILDRPNPHGDYVDGPVLEDEYSSFVGMHPVPVVHGMTVAEYARMLNGEKWLNDGIQCDLDVVEVVNYTHSTRYELPVAPSPNLPNSLAVDLYPSICFFEGTIISVGRGTEFPFQVIGHPRFVIGSSVFTPEDIPGKAINPKYKGKQCFGQSLINFAKSDLGKDRRLYLSWLINYYEFFKEREEFFTSYFEKLAGTNNLRKQIEEGLTEEMIRRSWEEDLQDFKLIRNKYLLYPDFE